MLPPPVVPTLTFQSNVGIWASKFHHMRYFR